MATATIIKNDFTLNHILIKNHNHNCFIALLSQHSFTHVKKCRAVGEIFCFVLGLLCLY